MRMAGWMVFATGLLLSATPLLISGEVRYFELVVSKAPLLPDGYSVLTYSINGNFPGPTLTAQVGDRLLINVTNSMFMHESLTMHWHGISQHGTQWADGTGSITNCPLPYGSSFLYNFTVERSGTFWYHSHAGETRIKGTYGLLIVKNPDPQPYAYDAEQHLILGDWYHGSTTDIDAGMMHKPFTWAGNGNSILMNGKGVCKECNLTGSSYSTTTTYSDSQWAPLTTSIPCQGKRENLFVHSGKTYLLRVLNAGSLAFFNFAIANHTLTLVGADGHAVEQTELSSIDIGPGCRVEVLVTANQQPPLPAGSAESFSFLMRAQTDWRGEDSTPAGIGWGYWTYIAPDQTTGAVSTVFPIAPPNESRDWNEWNSLLRGKVSAASSSYHPPPRNDQVTKRLVITLQQEYVDKETGLGYSPPLGVSSPQSSISSDMVLAWTLNGARWNMPSTPYLLDRYLHKLEGTVFDTDGTVPYRLELHDVVDITIQNSVAGNGVCEQHPWHMHGIHFWLVGQGAGQFSSEAEASYNTENPPLLDTVTGYPSNYSNRRGDSSSPAEHLLGPWQAPCGWVTLRMNVTNPGMWLFHCHIAWHTSMGMEFVFDAASELVTEYPLDMGLCGSAPARVSALSLAEEDSQSGGGGGEEPAISRMGLVGITAAVTFVATSALFSLLFLFRSRLFSPFSSTPHPLHSFDT
jgi:L-ascorbate oxidase